MTNFRDINVQFVEKFAYKRKNYITLIRIITGYMNTNNRLFKIGFIDLPTCNCGSINFVPQNLNHIFWACLLLVIQRKFSIL